MAIPRLRMRRVSQQFCLVLFGSALLVIVYVLNSHTDDLGTVIMRFGKGGARDVIDKPIGEEWEREGVVNKAGGVIDKPIGGEMEREGEANIEGGVGGVIDKPIGGEKESEGVASKEGGVVDNPIGGGRESEGVANKEGVAFKEESTMTDDQIQTFDGWPRFSKNIFPCPIPKSPFFPKFKIQWDYNTAEFLQREDVRTQPPKLMTWVVRTRYMPPLPEPVRLRFCPEMPCRMTTDKAYAPNSAALLWAGQIMREAEPPVRAHPDQVFVFHNHEPQSPEWTKAPSFRKPAWKSAFNWTMHYRFDSDIVDLYGFVAKRPKPVQKNYTEIMAKKTKFAAWLVSHCSTHGKREKYVELMQKYVTVDTYGACSKDKCPRNEDDACFKMINESYKFFLAFENDFCTDYISEKFFRYLEADIVVVARGSNQYKNHSPPGIFINTADFNNTKELTDYLLYLDKNPEKYIKILKAKDEYQPLYEEWPIRNAQGAIHYMHYHYEGVSYCEMCRRLWNLDQYRKHVPDIAQWFDKGNCYPPTDLI